MSRNKRLAALLLCALLLPLAAEADSELIAPDQIKADEVKYRTCVAERGDFVKTATGAGYEYYPVVTGVRYEGDTADFVKYLVKRGDEVKAGDAIATIRVIYDEVNLADLELKQERALEAYEEGVSVRQAAIDAARASLTAQGDDYERQISALKLRRLEIELDQYRYQQESSLTASQEQLDEMKSRYENETICAPCDGVISELTYFHVGDKINGGALIGRIERRDVMLIVVSGSNLRYGMSVTVETGINKNRVLLSGRVVAASDCVPNVTSNFVLIALDSLPDGEISWKNTKVVGDIVRLENVLLIDRKAAVLTSGKYVATKLTDEGIAQKRFVTLGLTSVDYAWILQGLDVGDTVIID